MMVAMIDSPWNFPHQSRVNIENPTPKKSIELGGESCFSNFIFDFCDSHFEMDIHSRKKMATN